MKGLPRSLRCPKCERGKRGREPQLLGCEYVGVFRQNYRSTRRSGRRQLGLARCHDCEHEWWSTVAGKLNLLSPIPTGYQWRMTNPLTWHLFFRGQEVAVMRYNEEDRSWMSTDHVRYITGPLKQLAHQLTGTR